MVGLGSIRFWQKNDKKVGNRGDSSHISELPLDHQLIFRDEEDEWRYHEGHIWLNDEAVEEQIDPENVDVAHLGMISSSLSRYKEHIYRQHPARYLEFVHQSDKIQEKILQLMKRIFDEKMGGLCLHWKDGIPYLRKMNIPAILVLYRTRPTLKARQFLEGVRDRLLMILQSKESSPVLDKRHGMIEKLISDVTESLENTPIDAICLPAASACSSL